MKRFAMAGALLCVLSIPAFAGDIPTADFMAPPPRPSATATGGSPNKGESSQMTQWVTLVLTLINFAAR